MTSRWIAMTTGALALTACGGGKAELVRNCAADGESRETCECMATAAEDELSPKLFSLLVDASSEGDAGAQQMLLDLSPEERGQFMAFGLKAAMSCGAE